MPAGATYEPIATTTLGSAQSTVNFTSFSGYTDLKIVMVATWSVNQQYANVRFNSDTGTNYSLTALNGNGSAAGSNRTTSATALRLGESFVVAGSTTIPTMGIMNIFSYAGSTNKTILTENSCDKNGTGSVSREVGLWRNTAAITSIDLIASGGNFNSGSTFTLYGIKAA